MQTNPLRMLHDQGQSFWCDYLSREMIESGKLLRLIEDDGLRGVTSNPTIFSKAIAGSDRYDATIRREARLGNPPGDIFDVLAQEDVQHACEQLMPVHEASGGQDGFVSLEESPHLAHHAMESVREGRRLEQLVDRPNLMVKVPATPEGIEAVRFLIAGRCKTNVTLMFSLDQYKEVTEAYIQGLEDRHVRGLRLDVPSVASIFLSRIDTRVDGWIDAIDEAAQRTVDEGAPDLARASALRQLRGRTAIAIAKLCYEHYLNQFHSERFRRLEAQGAHPQRLLFASTSTKDPTYSDTFYVEALIGPNTVVTMPPATIDAFRDHGVVERTLDKEMTAAHDVVQRLGDLGIDLHRAWQEPLDEGLRQFANSFDDLMETVSRKGRELAAA